MANFADYFATKPIGVWSAPGRVNLIGEHTDYNQGWVLPFAIDRRTTCTLAWNNTNQVRAVSTHAPNDFVTLNLATVENSQFSGWSGYALGIPWAFQRLGIDVSELPGVDILIDSDVPVGAGLSSSAAIESSIALALNEVWELGLSKLQLAQAGQIAENGAVGAPTGLMDQVASVFGKADHAVLFDCNSLDITPIPLGLAAHELTILVMDSRVAHDHATGGYADRRAACERGAAALGVTSLRELSSADLPAAEATLDDATYRRIRHVITENERVLAAVKTIQASGPQQLGPLMAASHASMRDDFEISVPEIDLAVATAVSAGAVGARLTGGGFGGAAIALVHTEAVEDVSAAVLAATQAAGFVAPSFMTVVPAQGAQRDE